MASIQTIHLPGDLNSDSKLKPKMSHNHVRMNSANFSDATPSSSLESTELNWGQYASISTQNPKQNSQEFLQDSYTLYQPEAEDSYGYQVSNIQKTQVKEVDFRRNPEFRPNNEDYYNSQKRQNSFSSRENPYHSQENSYRNQESNFQNRESHFQNRENHFQNHENSYPNQETSYRNQENGYRNQENLYQNQENNFQNQANGFQKHEKGFQNQTNQNGFQNQHENWVLRMSREKGFQIPNYQGELLNAQKNQTWTSNDVIYPETVNTQFPMDSMPTYTDKGGYSGEHSIHQAQLLVLASQLDSSLGCSGKHGFQKGCPDSQQYPDSEQEKCLYEPIVENVYELPSFSLPQIGTFEDSVKHWQTINRGLKVRNV